MKMLLRGLCLGLSHPHPLSKLSRRRPKGLEAAAILEAARARRVVLSVEEAARATGVEPGHAYIALPALNVRHRRLRPEGYLGECG